MKVKLVLVGSMHTGKTSIVNRYVNGDFSLHTLTTTQPAFSQKNLTYKRREISLDIWDTAGQEVYRNLVPMFFRGANVTILVAANDDINSIKGTAEWQEMVLQTAPNCKFLLVVNKADLPAGEGIDDSYISDMGRSIGALETFKTFELLYSRIIL